MSNMGRKQRQPDVMHMIDAQTEALILGSILSGGEAALRDVSFLSVDDFAVERHRTVFRAITDIASEVDPVLSAVYFRLDEIGKAHVVGGLTGLVDIEARAIPGIALERFAVKLREKTRDRRAWKLSAKLSVLCEQGFTANSNDVLAFADELRAVAENADWKAAGGVQNIRPAHEYGDAKIQSVLDGLLYEGTVNILTGDAGTGKSTLALAIAAAVAAGSVFAGRTTSRRPVLIVDRENTLAITIERLNRLGIRDGNGLIIWGGWCPTEPPGPESPEILSWVRACEQKPLIIFDSLIAFFGGQSENDSAEIRRYMDGFRRLAHAGCTILGLHHSGKGEGTKDYRGSSDIKAAIDSGLLLSNSGQGRLGRLCLRPWKSRFSIANEIALCYTDGQFTAHESIPAPTARERFIELLKANPEVNIQEFERLAGERDLARDAARKFLSEGVKTKIITREKGDHNMRKHTWVGSNEGGR
jgi:hypothetical protein